MIAFAAPTREQLVRARRITILHSTATNPKGHPWRAESALLDHPFGDTPAAIATYALFAYRVRAAAVIAKDDGYGHRPGTEGARAAALFAEGGRTWVCCTYPSARTERCRVLARFLTPDGLARLNAWASEYAPHAPGPLVRGKALTWADVPTGSGTADGRKAEDRASRERLAEAVRAILTDPRAVDVLSMILPRELRTARAALLSTEV